LAKINLQKIPINDYVLKNVNYGATILDGLRESSNMLKKYVPFISYPITAASTYNAFIDLKNNLSLETGYRVVNSAAGFVPFWGGFTSFMADTYEKGLTWFENWVKELEKQLQSDEFWLKLYGY
jgi:hypothetical protein